MTAAMLLTSFHFCFKCGEARLHVDHALHDGKLRFGDVLHGHFLRLCVLVRLWFWCRLWSLDLLPLAAAPIAVIALLCGI